MTTLRTRQQRCAEEVPGVLVAASPQESEPVLRGTAIPVDAVLASLADTLDVDRTVADFPGMTREQVAAALAFAWRLCTPAA